MILFIALPAFFAEGTLLRTASLILCFRFTDIDRCGKVDCFDLDPVFDFLRETAVGCTPILPFERFTNAPPNECKEEIS